MSAYTDVFDRVETSAVDPTARKSYVPMADERAHLFWQLRSWASHLIWFLGCLVVLPIAARVLFRYMGLGPEITLVGRLYDLSAPLIAPFAGFTLPPSANPLGLEGPALIAIFVYTAVVWLLLRLTWLLLSPRMPRTKPVKLVDQEWD